MRALGIDVGMGESPSAMALARMDGSELELLHHSTHQAPPKLAWERRVQFIGRAIYDAIITLRPDLVACEAAHQGIYRRIRVIAGQEVSETKSNPQTLRKLAAVEGAVMLACELAGVPFVSIQPAEAKLALAGNSQADKQAMMEWARRLSGKQLPSHEADALGIGMAGERKYQRAGFAQAAAAQGM